MTLGERLFEYRNSINISQEKLAEKIGVTRQTISKWETDQSTPDFDKIIPLCEAFGITTEELIKGEKSQDNEKKEQQQDDYTKKRNKRKAIVLSISVFIYCIATFGLPYMLEVLHYEDAHAVMIWATLCTIATILIIYFFVAYPNTDKNVEKEINNQDDVKSESARKKSKTEALVIEIIAMIFLIVYLVVSFFTMAWHITWILWLVFALVELVVKLIFDLKGEKNEK